MMHFVRTTTMLPAMLAAMSLNAVASPTLPLPPPKPPMPMHMMMMQPPESTLTITGEGKASKAPDEANISVQIITDDANAARSSSKNNDIYNALKAHLNFPECKSCELRDASYGVEYIPYPAKNLPPEQRQPRYGYVTTRSLQITVPTLTIAGRVIDAATSSGVTNVGDVSFDLKDRRTLYMNALASALNDAKQQADTLASAGGFRIVRIHTVTTGYVPSAPAPMPMMKLAESAGSTPTEFTSSGPIDVNARVTVTYVIR